MKITCPKCKARIEVNPAKLLGGMSSPAKARAARLNAMKPRKRKNSTIVHTIDEVSDWAASHAKLPRLPGKPQPVQPFQKKLIRALTKEGK